MQLKPDDVIKLKCLVKHLNKAHFKEISVADTVEVSTLLVWLGREISTSEKPKINKKAGVSKK